jgi:hypothetical protein
VTATSTASGRGAHGLGDHVSRAFHAIADMAAIADRSPPLDGYSAATNEFSAGASGAFANAKTVAEALGAVIHSVNDP